MTGPASMAELQALHGLVVRELVEQLKAKPSAEMLGVARALLRHNQVTAETDNDARQLREMHQLLTRRLHEAVSSGAPSASVLAEVRHWLAHNGVSADLGAAVDQAEALQALESLELPFATKQ